MRATDQKLIPWDTFAKAPNVRNLVEEFQMRHNGESEFLKYLWTKWPDYSHRPNRTTGEEQERWLSIWRMVKKLQKALGGVDYSAIDGMDLPHFQRYLETIDEFRGFAESCKKSRPDDGRPLKDGHRYYWASALVPYFRYRRTKRDPWLWLTHWFSVLETKRVPETESLKRSWQRLAVKRANRDASALVAKYGGRVWTASESMPPFEACLLYLSWKDGTNLADWSKKSTGWSRAEEGVRYQRAVANELPFAKTLGWLPAFWPREPLY